MTAPTTHPALPTPPAVRSAHASAVPWSTVVPLALVLTYADGFWITALHGAVGDISRTQEPFTTYWRTSTLMVPVFVLAVLAASTWALRRFGPQARSRREVVITGLLVAGAATAAAIGLAGVSAAYDYHLQSSQLGAMQSMRSDCDTACLGRQRWQTAGSHARAIGYTGTALLVTNLALVAWYSAIRGGTLPVARPERRVGGAIAVTTGDRAQDLRRFLVVGLLTSAAIHAAVVPEHLREWRAAGVFFLALTVAELVVAGLLHTSRTRVAALGALAVSAVPLALWLVSRTTGLPFGPEPGATEAVGLADSVACLLEISTLVVAALSLRRPAPSARPPLSAHRRALVLVAVLALGAIGLAGVAPAWLDGADLSDAGDTMEHQPR